MHRAAAFAGAIEHWLTHRDEREPLNLAALYDYLVAEHSYPGSLRSLQRYFKAHYPQPPIRARRRVETPPGAQAQADWGDFPPKRGPLSLTTSSASTIRSDGTLPWAG